MPRLRRVLVPTFFIFLLASGLIADDPKRSEKYSFPPRDPPSRDFDFLHLKLECSFDWDQESVEGKVTHTARAFRDGVRAVELNAVGIEVRSVQLAGGQGLAFEVLPETLRIDLGREVKRGEELTFTVAYRARPKAGVYFRKPDASYPDTPKEVWTQGEAEEARHWIPCFDHPSDKVTSETFVLAPNPLGAISNGALAGVEARGDGRVFHWVQDKPHATYLIVVVVGEFAEYRGDADGIPLTAHVQKRHEALAKNSFELTADMVRFFGERTGVRYPWAKYDQLCISGFLFGGMENTSATTLNENTLHDDRAALDVSSMDLVAHELAHQWFGDLVTCKDWGDTWLNESFATFFENLYTEHHLGWDEGVHERRGQAESYKAEDRESYRRRLSLRTWGKPEDLFDRHTYPKGARVLSMLRRVLGDELFFAGVKHYLTKHAYQSVETADFRVALEEATGVSLGWFFDEWLLSGGHPSFKVRHDWDSKAHSLRVEVEQTQKVDDLTPLFRMPVVIEVTQPSGKTSHEVWVSERKHVFTLPAGERPSLVRFDPGDWILKDIDDEKSKEELLFQLERDADVMGRHDAAVALKPRAGEEDVAAALFRRLEAEPFWGVRDQIVGAIAAGRPDGAWKRLKERFGSEPKSRVRRAIVRAAGELMPDGVASFLRDAVAKDASYYVAADALRALGRVAKRDAVPDAVAALGRDSHEDEIRSAAVDVFAMDGVTAGEDRAAVIERLVGLASPAGHSSDLRGSALHALAKVGRGNDAAFKAIASALDDTRLQMRKDAMGALVELGDPRGIDVLRERLKKEQPVVLRNPVDQLKAAIGKLEARGADLKGLQEEVRRLKERLDELEGKPRTRRL